MLDRLRNASHRESQISFAQRVSRWSCSLERADSVGGVLARAAGVAPEVSFEGVCRELNGIALPTYTDEDWMRFARRTFREDASGKLLPARACPLANAFADGDHGQDDSRSGDSRMGRSGAR
jgi:hypothetical protein